MRKPFRTTLDEDLLTWLKKEAVNQGVNANDILETLISSKAFDENYTKDKARYLGMNPLGREDFLARRLKVVIDDFFKAYDLEIDEHGGYYEEIARLLARLAMSHTNSPFKEK